MYEYANQSSNEKNKNKILHKEKNVQRFKDCPVVQRMVIDARSKRIPNEHLSIILGMAAKQWTPTERKKWDAVIRELVIELGEANENIYTIDQAVMLLASRKPVDIGKPLYPVNETSAEGDVAQDIAKNLGGTMRYTGPVGEEITGVNGTIREEMQEGDDSELMWVLKRDESVRVHKRNTGVRTPHPTLVGEIIPL